jgi:hypothetical protein
VLFRQYGNGLLADNDRNYGFNLMSHSHPEPNTPDPHALLEKSDALIKEARTLRQEALLMLAHQRGVIVNETRVREGDQVGIVTEVLNLVSGRLFLRVKLDAPNRGFKHFYHDWEVVE